jgi:hypothetical protein
MGVAATAMGCMAGRGGGDCACFGVGGCGCGAGFVIGCGCGGIGDASRGGVGVGKGVVTDRDSGVGGNVSVDSGSWSVAERSFSSCATGFAADASVSEAVSGSDST